MKAGLEQPRKSPARFHGNREATGFALLLASVRGYGAGTIGEAARFVSRACLGPALSGDPGSLSAARLADRIHSGAVTLPASAAAYACGDMVPPLELADSVVRGAAMLLSCDATATHCLVPVRVAGKEAPSWTLLAFDHAEIALDRERAGGSPSFALALLEMGAVSLPDAQTWHGAPEIGDAVADQRLLLAHVALDAAQRAFDSCVVFVRSRGFGTGTAADHQAVRHRLAEMKAAAAIAAAWLSVAVEQRLATGIASAADAAGACATALRAAGEIAEDARQLFGGRGFLLDNPVASLGLDIVTLQAFTGPVASLEMHAADGFWSDGGRC